MEGVTNGFSNFTKGVGDFFNGIGKAFETLWGWLGDICNAVGNIASSVVDGIGKFFVTLWDWLGKITTAIGDIASSVVNGISNLLNILFVPENNPFENLSTKFDEKFGFVNQIKDLASNLLGFSNYGNNVPSFTITWQGVTVAIIDFSLFLDYRTWIHGIILAIAWSVFILKTYRKLPTIIGGFSQ